MGLLDIFIIVIMIGNLFHGYHKGFIWTLFSLASYLIAFQAARWYHLDLALWVQNNTGILDKLKGFFAGKSDGLFDQFFIIPKEGIGTPTKLLEPLEHYFAIETNLNRYAIESIDAVKEQFITNITTFILNILCLLFIFFVVRGLIMLMGNLFDQLFKLPLLSTVNQMGGLAIGALKGFIIIFVTLIIVLVIGIAYPNGWIAGLLENSISIQVFFEYIFPFLFPIQ